jgi:hypothetical protein
MLIALAIKHQVTAMQATPENWSVLTAFDLKPATAFKVLCGGEALSLSLARKILDRKTIGLWNRHGPWASGVFTATPLSRKEQEKLRKIA